MVVVGADVVPPVADACAVVFALGRAGVENLAGTGCAAGAAAAAVAVGAGAAGGGVTEPLGGGVGGGGGGGGGAGVVNWTSIWNAVAPGMPKPSAALIQGSCPAHPNAPGAMAGNVKSAGVVSVALAVSGSKARPSGFVVASADCRGADRTVLETAAEQ